MYKNPAFHLLVPSSVRTMIIPALCLSSLIQGHFQPRHFWESPAEWGLCSLSCPPRHSPFPKTQQMSQLSLQGKAGTTPGPFRAQISMVSPQKMAIKIIDYWHGLGFCPPGNSLKAAGEQSEPFPFCPTHISAQMDTHKTARLGLAFSRKLSSDNSDFFLLCPWARRRNHFCLPTEFKSCLG